MPLGIKRKHLFFTALLLIPVIILLLGIPFLQQQYLKFKSQALKQNIVNKTVPDYTIVFVGDSLTEYLGNFDELQAYLTEYYPGKSFLLLNYGFGSTNLLSLPDRLNKESSHSGRTFQPINQIRFDLIIIESFGHNPLSKLPLEKGLIKQNEILDESLATLKSSHPKESIVFMATIAPNKENYAKGGVELTSRERMLWANERAAYIKNHIKYARSHGIPIIDIYSKSLAWDGDGNLDFISKTDYIHPSPKGVYFISNEIAKFIVENKLLKSEYGRR
jgi:lysophospholipase L1-like esterase